MIAMSPHSSSLTGHCHKTVTKLISFSNVSAIRRASARAVRYGFSMHLIGELAMPLFSKKTG
jgi:hypothetical protein